MIYFCFYRLLSGNPDYPPPLPDLKITTLLWLRPMAPTLISRELGGSWAVAGGEQNSLLAPERERKTWHYMACSLLLDPLPLSLKRYICLSECDSLIRNEYFSIQHYMQWIASVEK
jgi:hypothetical protein